MNLSDYRFTETHEWAHVRRGLVYVGVTDHAQEEMTDVVGVDLPEPGVKVAKGDELLFLDSVKAAFSIFAPVSGAIVEVNHAVESDPSLVNSSPYEEGWIVAIEPTDITEMDDLMTSEEYEEHIESEL